MSVDKSSPTFTQRMKVSLLDLLQKTTSNSAQFTLYGLAAGALALSTGTVLPGALGMLAGGVGVNALYDILKKTAEGESVTEDLGENILENAVNELIRSHALADTENQRLIGKLVSDLALLQYAVDRNETAILIAISKQSQNFQPFMDAVGNDLATIEQKLDKLISAQNNQPNQKQFQELIELIRQTRTIEAQTDGLIFISYSRTDTDFAKEIYQKLSDLGFKLWRDRSEMEAGADWWQQIQEAIRTSETLVLLISPKALASPIVAKEWRYARQVGTRVIPVIAENIDFNHVPRWMARLDWLDFRISAPENELIWKKFVHQLNQIYEPARVPFTVPDLPIHFVERQGEMNELFKLLLDEDRENPVFTTVALHGNSGFGKSTLAQAFCHHEDTQQAFSDGILWITLGEQPDVLQLLLDQIEYVSGEGRPGFTDLNVAAKRLDELLTDREMLLVIDDIWNEKYARPFVEIGNRCAHLLTTRRQDISVGLRANSILIKEMQTTESASLLIKWLDETPDNIVPLEELGRDLGEWPLLLTLAGAYIRESILIDRRSLQETVLNLRRRLERRGYITLDHADEKQRNRAISFSLEISLEKLGRWREVYLQLAIFAPDTAIPFGIIEQLWKTTAQMDALDTEDALGAMQRLSLFSEYDISQKTLLIHDGVRVYLSSQLKDQAFFHAKLIDLWGDPHVLSDDYAWHHYIYHLRGAAQYKQILQLVDKPFLEKKLQRFNSYAPIYADLKDAAAVAGEMKDHCRMLALALAYNGLQSKIVRLSNTKVIPLYARFGLVDRAMEFARVVEDQTHRASVLVEIAQELQQIDLRRCRQILQDVLKNWKKYEPGYKCGIILRRTFEIWPEAVIELFEQIEDFSAVYSLGHSSLNIPYDALYIIGERLEPKLQKRLIAALKRLLPLAENDYWNQELSSALFWFIPDVNEAVLFATSENYDAVSQLVAVAKEEVFHSIEKRPSAESLHRAIILFSGRQSQANLFHLFHSIIGPNFSHSKPAIENLINDELIPIDEKIQALLDLAWRRLRNNGSEEDGKILILKALHMNSLGTTAQRSIEKNSFPAVFRLALEALVESLADGQIQAALDFLNLQIVKEVVNDNDARNLYLRVIDIAARSNPLDALQLASQLNFQEGHYAKAFVARGFALSDLRKAISIWNDLEDYDNDKQDWLIKILGNASPRDYPYALQILATKFQPQQPNQLYKIPMLLEVASRLQIVDESKAKLIEAEALDILSDRLAQEREGARIFKEFFLLKLLRPRVLLSKTIEEAVRLTRQFSEENGFSSVAFIIILDALADAPALKKEVTSSTIQSLLSRTMYYDEYGWSSSGGVSDEVLDLGQNLGLYGIKQGLLFGLYLQHKSHTVMLGWEPDYAKALVASHLAQYKISAALKVAEQIRDEELRRITLLDLLPFVRVNEGKDAIEWGNNNAINALAALRTSALLTDQHHKQQVLETAFQYALKGINSYFDLLDLNLLIEFLCESSIIDNEKTLDICGKLINQVLKIKHHSYAHHLYKLNRAGYIFTEQERIEINKKSGEWLSGLKDPENGLGEEDANRLAAEILITLADSIQSVDLAKSMQYIDEADRYCAKMLIASNRRRLKSRSLKTILRAKNLEVWEKAVTYSIGYDAAIFDVTDDFARVLMELRLGDADIYSRLKKALEWADELMKL